MPSFLPRHRPHAAFQDFCPVRARRYVLVAAILASAMGFIDGTVVSIAIPAIRSGLGAGLAEVQWINNAYVLVLASLMLIGGALGDRYGLRTVFASGIGVFALASILCALALSPQLLIAARVVQGAGAAVMIPGSLAIISKSYPKAERGKAIGIWAAASAVTTAAGPILGGALLSAGGADAWRLVFAINVPIGLATLYLLLMRVPPDRPEAMQPVDIGGAILATAGLGLLAWGLTDAGGQQAMPGPEHIVGYTLAGLLVLGAFIGWERRVAAPMMPLRVFASMQFSAANAVTFALYFALSAILFYLPMTLISGWHMAAAVVGVIFLPLTLAIAVLSGPVGAQVSRFGSGALIGTGALMVAVAFFILGLGLPWHMFWGHVFACLCLMGLGMALVVAPLSDAVMEAVDDADSGAASGINNAVSRMAGLIAVAALGGVAALAFQMAGGKGQFGGSIVAQGMDSYLSAMNAGFAWVAWISAILSAIAALLAFRFLPVGPVAADPAPDSPGR